MKFSDSAEYRAAFQLCEFMFSFTCWGKMPLLFKSFMLLRYHSAGILPEHFLRHLCAMFGLLLGRSNFGDPYVV